jgi:hypothetical protein
MRAYVLLEPAAARVDGDAVWDAELSVFAVGAPELVA